MTDGEQTVEEGSGKTVNEILAEASKPLKDKNVHIISLGIGARVNKQSLETIATPGNNVYYARTFNALRQLVRELRKGSCSGKETDTNSPPLNLKINSPYFDWPGLLRI